MFDNRFASGLANGFANGFNRFIDNFDGYVDDLNSRNNFGIGCFGFRDDFSEWTSTGSNRGRRRISSAVGSMFFAGIDWLGRSGSRAVRVLEQHLLYGRGDDFGFVEVDSGFALYVCAGLNLTSWFPGVSKFEAQPQRFIEGAWR